MLFWGFIVLEGRLRLGFLRLLGLWVVVFCRCRVLVVASGVLNASMVSFAVDGWVVFVLYVLMLVFFVLTAVCGFYGF